LKRLALNLNSGSGNDRGVSTGLSLADLRAHLVPARDLEARERRARLSTGSEALDQLLGGGWPRGAVSEIRGARGQGRTTVLLASIAASLQAGHATALIDFGASFDPRAAARAGILLDRLLWVRTPAVDLDRAAGAHGSSLGGTGPRGLAGRRRSPERLLLGAAETILSAGGFGLLALDFGERVPAIPSATWIRLRQLVTGPGTVVLVVAAHPVSNLFGATSLCLERARPEFSTSPQPSEIPSAIPSAIAAARHAPPLLTSIETLANCKRPAGAGDGNGAGGAGPHATRLPLVHAPT
jgi:hypothetical protein